MESSVAKSEFRFLCFPCIFPVCGWQKKIRCHFFFAAISFCDWAWDPICWDRSDPGSTLLLMTDLFCSPEEKKRKKKPHGPRPASSPDLALGIRGDRSEKRPARTKKQKQPPCADMTLNVE